MEPRSAATSANSDLESRRARLSPQKRALLERRLRGVEAPPASERIRPRPLDGPPPLSYAQQRLWFLDQLAPGSAFYNIATAIRLEVPIDVGVLRRSLNEIVRRHESLRTTFPTVDGNPVQAIAPSLTLDLPVIDLARLPAAEREEAALRLATDEAARPFDLSSGPLIRTTLLHLGPARYYFLLTLHHIIADGWSMGVFSRELTANYLAFSTGMPAPLGELEIQYRDFSAWQREWLESGARQEQLDYWKRQLADLSELQLPGDRPRPHAANFRGDYFTVALPGDLTEKLKRLSRETDCTLFMTLLAGFKAVLARYARQEDIVVGAPIANRNRKEIEDLIGFFVNSLVLRTSLEGDPTFRELMARVRKTSLDAYANQDLPFESLVEELQPERDLSRNPLFQVTFQLINTIGGDRGNDGKVAAQLEVQRHTAIFDLAVSMYEDGGALAACMEYSTERFEKATIAGIFRCLSNLLEAAVADPDKRLSELPLLSPRERREALTTWNQTRDEAPFERCLHHLFEE